MALIALNPAPKRGRSKGRKAAGESMAKKKTKKNAAPKRRRKANPVKAVAKRRSRINPIGVRKRRANPARKRRKNPATSESKNMLKGAIGAVPGAAVGYAIGSGKVSSKVGMIGAGAMLLGGAIALLQGQPMIGGALMGGGAALGGVALGQMRPAAQAPATAPVAGFDNLALADLRAGDVLVDASTGRMLPAPSSSSSVPALVGAGLRGKAILGG